MASYFFLTTWILDAPRDEVWDAIYAIESWPAWWQGVRRVDKLEHGNGDGVRCALPAGVAQRHPLSRPLRGADHRHRAPVRDRGGGRRRARRTGRWRFFDGRETAVTYEWNVHTTRRWMNLARADRAAGLPLEPQRRHAPGRAKVWPICWGRDSWPSRSLQRMRVLVTGGAGFIGSHFAKRLLAAGDDVRVLDKLTYSGNPANLDGTGIELVVGDICDADAVAEAAAGCDAIVNFAAETHVDRSILGATDFGRTEFFGTQVLFEEVRRTGARFVQVSTDEVYGDLAAGGSAAETDPSSPPARTASPRPPATSTSRRTRGRSASTLRSRAARTRTGRTSTRRS